MPDDAGAPLRSFRDPDGCVIVDPDGVYRFVDQLAWGDVSQLLNGAIGQALIEAGDLVASRELTGADRDGVAGRYASAAAAFGGDDCVVVEHDRIPFVSYPYEWPPGMLGAAGQLTLDLHRRLLAAGRGLKDATPFNVLFRGTKPVLIDILSIESRDAEDPLWRADAQFARTFLLPLLAYRELGLAPHERFLISREGWEPKALYDAVSVLRRLKPGVFGAATLPTWLSRSASSDKPETYRERRIDAERARFTLEHNAKSRAKALAAVLPDAPHATAWTDYESDLPYDAADHERKIAFVAAALERAKPGAVLDLGCNTGRYSLMAAEAGASVVAIDSDHGVAEMLYHRARDAGADILPLIGNIAQPTPAMGWRNRECAALLDRAVGRFDMVFGLALYHHLVVSERVPMHDVIGVFADLTREHVVLEYVDPTDKNFRRIVRGREELYADMNVDAFRAAVAPHFDVVEHLELIGGERHMFHLSKRAG